MDHNRDIEVCHECGLRVKVPELVERQKAVCPRCGFVLSAKHCNAIDRILAFSMAAIIFLLATLSFEFLSINANGQQRTINFPSSFKILIENNYPALALLEAVTIFAIPFIVLSGFIYLLAPLRKGVYPFEGIRILNIIFKLIPWSMVEIFLIGALVSLIKIQSQADISLGPSFFAFILFTMSMSAALLHIDRRQLYQKLKIAAANAKARSKTSNIDIPIERQAADKLSVNKPAKQPISFKSAKSLSIQQTWAFLITAVILYLPANFLPIMNTRTFGQDDLNTILGGVIKLWNMESYPIAIIIFIASIVVPVVKIIALAWLNYSVQRSSTFLSQERSQLYRLAEFIGRWSMVDVYAVIILVSLIQLGSSMSIYPGTAILAFSGVVVLTMLAAISFDQKLIWNIREPYANRNTS